MQKREFLKGGLAAIGMLGCGAAAAKAAGEGDFRLRRTSSGTRPST